MIAGDKSLFAIESEISQAYAQLSFRARGFFVIYIKGLRYGLYSNDATFLACSFDEVRNRITRRGNHSAPFSAETNAGCIADAFREVVYDPSRKAGQYFGILANEFRAIINTNHIMWAPDGDQAFDDGSYVLHFDVGDRVRLSGIHFNRPYPCRNRADHSGGRKDFASTVTFCYRKRL